MILDPKMHYFPDPDESELVPFAVAFARMMFAHARLEARIREVQGLVAGDPGFGDVKKNQWPADKRASCMTKLIATHLGEIPETKEIADCLAKSSSLSWERNLLAHGEWWAFDPEQQIITVRSGTVWPNEEQHQERAVVDIDRTASELQDIEAELYKLQSRIENQRVNLDTATSLVDPDPDAVH
jgi:hypothetical protein